MPPIVDRPNAPMVGGRRCVPLATLLAGFFLCSCHENASLPQLRVVEVEAGCSNFTGELYIHREGEHERNYVHSDSEHCEFAVFTSVGVDFTALDGSNATLLASEPSSYDYDERQNLALLDGQSRPSYLAARETRFVEDVFGRPIVALGELQAEDRSRQWILSFWALRFHGDEETVELMPGEAALLRIDGRDWWALVHSAVTASENRRHDLADCIDYGGWRQMLSFELRRADLFDEPSLETPESHPRRPRC